MTVIAGLETTVGEKAVVIGSDKLQTTQEHAWVKCLSLIEKSPDFDLSPYFDFLEETERDKVVLSSTQKIKLSLDSQRVLTHTGVDNKAHEQICEFLLETDRFLQNIPLLTALFFPIGHPIDETLLKKYIELYRTSFDFDRNMVAEHIPEVRRIFDIHAAGLNVKDTPLGVISKWDRNYNPVLSEYLFAKELQGVPRLFEITTTGAVVYRQYFANGAGGQYALEHLRSMLGTFDASLFCPTESRIKREVDLDEAVRIVRGAIEYADYCNPFCRGFDYVILRKEGVEPHFSDEEFSHELSILDLIENRRQRSIREAEQLQRIKCKYLGRT